MYNRCRDGEEASAETVSSGTVRTVFTISRQGIHGFKRIGDKVVVFKTKVHKDFAVNVSIS